MTLWLPNIAAFSVQLAALIGTGAIVVALLRLDAPAARLRFWQLLLAASLLWPAYQLLVNADGVRTSAAGLSALFSAGVLRGGVFPTVSAARSVVEGLDARFMMMILAVLTAGAIVRCIWLAFGWLKVRSIIAASEPAHAVSPVAATLQRELGVTADIRFSDAVDGPATIGGRRAVVLLPPRVVQVPPAVQRAVLCHELMHVRRRDWLPTVFEELWCSFLWFHPAAWVLTSRLRLAREALIDRAAVSHTRDRRAYAQALLEFSGSGAAPAGASALIGRRHLEQRIALIAQEVSMSRSSVAVRLATAACAATLATLVASFNVPMQAAMPARMQEVYKPSKDQGVTLPVAVKGPKPEYTAAALQARIQGLVHLAVVVLPSGDVGEVTVTQSLDQEYGLDQAAVDAARLWKFKPGTKNGKPVAVEVTLEMRFTLK